MAISKFSYTILKRTGVLLGCLALLYGEVEASFSDYFDEAGKGVCLRMFDQDPSVIAD